MAHSKSALKRIRQNEKRRMRNRIIKSRVKSFLTKSEYAIKNKQDDSEEIIKDFISAIDKAVKKGIYHKNTAARKKSKLMKKLNLSKIS